MKRFKIDYECGYDFPYKLYRNNKRFLFDEWDQIGSFKTRDEARAFYQEVKDLPEYLD